MPKQTWTLTDVEQDLYVESLALSSANVKELSAGCAVTKRTLRGGLRDGVDVIEVDNGMFRFVIVPTRGMGLWNALCGDTRLGWKSPIKGPVHPAFVPVDAADGLGWLNGFDELLVRCGLESNGSPEFHPNGTLRYGLHGKIANLPAHRVTVSVDGDAGEISISGSVDESRLFGNKLRLTSTYTTRIGQPGVTVTDVVTNLSERPSELQLLYHINFGAPLLAPGAKVVLPVKKMVPRTPAAIADLSRWDVYGPETPGAPEVVYFYELIADAAGRTRALLHNAEGDRGIGMSFSKRELPYFILWKNCHAAVDGYVTGLEPAINFPNRRSFEKSKGRVTELAPGESRTFEVVLESYGDAASVASARRAIQLLQETRRPEIAESFDPNWVEG